MSPIRISSSPTRKSRTHINLGKAAELLNVSAVELRQRFVSQGVPVRVGAESVDTLRAEVAAAERRE